MGPNFETAQFLDQDARVRVLRGIFQNYYEPLQQKYIFDNNRRWTANIDLLATLFPSCRLLVCVRPVPAVIDSIEQAIRKDPTLVSVMCDGKTNTTVYERYAMYMRPSSVVGFAYNALKTAWYGPQRNRMLIIRYDDLARFPEDVMNDVHKALDIPPFEYDYENILPIPGVKDFDRGLGTPGLHDLLPAVSYEPRPCILPPDIIAACPPAFWDVQKPVTKSE